MKKQKVVNVEIKRKTLKQRYMEGKITDLQEAFLDETDLWHDSDSTLSLAEFLGLNTTEYILFVKDPDEFEYYLKTLKER